MIRASCSIYSSIVNVFYMASSMIPRVSCRCWVLAFSLILYHQIWLAWLHWCRVVHESSSIALFPNACEIQDWSCFGFVYQVEVVLFRRARRWYHMGLLPLHLPSRALYRTPKSRHTHDIFLYHASCPSASSACSPPSPGPDHRLCSLCSLALRIGSLARGSRKHRVPLDMVALLVSSLLVGHTT